MRRGRRSIHYVGFEDNFHVFLFPAAGRRAKRTFQILFVRDQPPAAFVPTMPIPLMMTQELTSL